jgi:hypothetical protein
MSKYRYRLIAMQVECVLSDRTTSNVLHKDTFELLLQTTFGNQGLFGRGDH